MISGNNTAKITIRRRASVADPTGGTTKGDYADAFSTWCGWKQATGTKKVENGLVEDDALIVARVNDGIQNRSISIADRATLLGQDYEIATVGLPERIGAYIEMTLRKEQGGL